MIAFIIPSYNNLQHLKNVYESICKNAPEAKMMFLDDGSTDGTYEWLMSLPKDNMYAPYRSEERVGHTILYDKGISLVDEEIVGILHADMIVGPKYVENMIKHLQPGKVVCATRIEPPLHPAGNEKIIKDFGMDFDTLDIQSFEEFCQKTSFYNKDKTTKGMFAPWIIYKKDFEAIGGHDPLFAPFPYEDSDIFQRWILAGYELVQSWDAFVYHLTCRGHRWNEQVGKDDDYYKIVSQRAARNYIRKWGSWIKNNEYQYPIISHKYNVHAILKNAHESMLESLEPWFSCVYVDTDIPEMVYKYYNKEQRNTTYDLTKRIKLFDKNLFSMDGIDILVEIDGSRLTQYTFNVIQNLSDILTETNEVGEFELDCLRITITNLRTYENELIVCNTI